MSDTPLSDVMTEHADTRSRDAYDRFLALFRTSTIGIIATGIPVQAGPGIVTTSGSIGAGKTTYGDGRLRILAHADPETFLRTFGPQFNAGVSGEVLLNMAANDPTCEGILVNSAVSEISMIISKSTAISLVESSGAPTAQASTRRSWRRRG